MSDLKPILGMAYREMVINHSEPVQAIAMFKTAAASDPELVETARHRIARTAAIHEKKCFITKKEVEFLKIALDAPDLPKSETVDTSQPPVIVPSYYPSKRKE